MNSQDFLILNVSCIILFLLWYWRSRESSSSRPTKLKMHAPDSAPLALPPERSADRPAKNLNVIFNYNGHSWDAYEVLGVPAGSSPRDVTAAYQTALQTTDPKSHAFLEVAYKAILTRF